jgi:hypothetical protein
MVPPPLAARMRRKQHASPFAFGRIVVVIYGGSVPSSGKIPDGIRWPDDKAATQDYNVISKTAGTIPAIDKTLKT